MLADRDPVAKLAAAFLPALALLSTVDLVSAAVVLIATLPCVPLLGLRWSALPRRLWPMGVAAVSVVIGTAVFTDQNAGAVLVDLGPVLVTTDSVLVGCAAALRLLGVALPGVLVVLTIDPVDLADSLVRHLRVPARFAYGSLAALRTAPLMALEWQVLGRARRARGLEAGRNPVVAVRLFAGKVFALLVGALRRAVRLAAAMDARGFDQRTPRTQARDPRFTRQDVALVLGSALLSAAAITLSVLTGAFNPILS